MSRENKDLVVGLDIGTTKITCVVAESGPDGQFQVVGMGAQPSHGLKKGMVVNIEATVDAISKAVAEAESMAGCKISEVYTGITGSHIKSSNSNGLVAIREKEVSTRDIASVIDVARAMPIPAEQQILLIHTQEFTIDGQDGVREPIGMSGVRLEAKVHIVTGAVAAAQNVIKCVRRCGLEVMDLVVQPYASSHSVLTEDERELGVCLIDIGGGTTDIALFTRGAIRHTGVLTVAGDQITNDIAMTLRTPTAEAENIKIQYGVAISSLPDPEVMIEVPGVGDRPARKLSRQALADVIHPRVEEIFEMIQDEIKRSGYEELLSSGLVLTGNAALMPGMVELGEDIFHMPVRVGLPQYSGPMADHVGHPGFASVMGLIMEGIAQRKRGIQARETRSMFQAFGKMKSWFDRNF
jgi:cell division protein FtsA